VSLADSDEIANEILREAAESLRRDLYVAVDRPGGNAIRIVVTLAGADPDSIMRRVNDVAARYAATLHQRAVAGLLRRAAEVGSADQLARQEVRGIREELDGLIRRVVSEAARASVAPPSEPADYAGPDSQLPVAATPDSGPTRPGSDLAPPGENPEWTAARKRLEQLLRHRAYLLVDRTPVHPEVLQADTLIAEAERRLASIPSRVPEAPPAVPQKTPSQTAKPPAAAAQGAKKAPADTASASPQVAELSQAIQRQRDRMDRVSRDLEQSAALDLDAAQRLVRGDDLHLRPAQHANAIAVRLELGDLLLVGLAAGLMAAAGIGMIWTGAAFDPPLTSRRSVEQCLAVPVVGTIAVDQAAGSPGSLQVGVRRRLPYIVGGLAIIAVYLVFLLHPLLAR